MTDTEVAKLVAVLIGAFPNARITGGTPLVYERMLKDLDPAVAAAAVERLLATSRFLPSIAEIREAALQLTDGEQRDGADAWGDVLDAVHEFGIYSHPEFDDPIVAGCIASMGWTNICNSDNETAVRARFIDLYNHESKVRRRDAATRTLPLAKQLRGGSSSTGALAAGAIRELAGDDQGGGKR